MADTGWVTFGTGANNADAGATAWSNPGNITTATDAAAATSSMAKSSGSTQYLHGTNAALSGLIPSGSTIDGIEALIRSQAQYNGAAENTVQLIVGGARAGSNKAATYAWSGSPVSRTYGGASDLWGLTPSRADVVASNFGLAWRMTNGAAATSLASTQYMQIKVHYTEPAPTGNAGAMFMLWRMKDRIREILKPKKKFWLPEPAFARAA